MHMLFSILFTTQTFNNNLWNFEIRDKVLWAVFFNKNLTFLQLREQEDVVKSTVSIYIQTC